MWHFFGGWWGYDSIPFFLVVVTDVLFIEWDCEGIYMAIWLQSAPQKSCMATWKREPLFARDILSSSTHLRFRRLFFSCFSGSTEITLRYTKKLAVFGKWIMNEWRCISYRKIVGNDVPACKMLGKTAKWMAAMHFYVGISNPRLQWLFHANLTSGGGVVSIISRWRCSKHNF